MMRIERSKRASAIWRRYVLAAAAVLGFTSLAIAAGAASQQSGGYKFSAHQADYSHLPTTQPALKDELKKREDAASAANKAECEKAINDAAQQPGLIASAVATMAPACCAMKPKLGVASFGTGLSCVQTAGTVDWVATLPFTCGGTCDPLVSMVGPGGAAGGFACAPDPMLPTDDFGNADPAGTPGWALGVEYECSADTTLVVPSLDPAEYPDIDWSVIVPSGLPPTLFVSGTAVPGVESPECLPDLEGFCTTCDPAFPTDACGGGL